MDSSDVCVWHKIGKLAIRMDRYSLARHAYEQGLQCNPKHWPCLDMVITVLYSLGNYHTCLQYIARALEMDAGYIKGIVFREQIFSEQASLRKDYPGSVQDDVFHIDKQEFYEFIDEALKMRTKRQELCKPPEREPVQFCLPLTAYTFHRLGECLVAVYNKLQAAGGREISHMVELPETLSNRLPEKSTHGEKYY